MKKTILIIAAFITGFTSIAQSPGPHPNNVDLGLFNNGANGSNGSSGALLEVALRIKLTGVGYTVSPACEDFQLYVVVPKADFTGSETVNIVEKNAAIFGAGTMAPQGNLIDIGDPMYYYVPLILVGGGMNLNPLNFTNNAWSYGFTLSFTPAPASFAGVRIIDQTNNTYVSTTLGIPTYTVLLMSNVNQLTNAAFTVLPVELLSFSGYKDGSRNQLKWRTASEQNNKGFEVLRSLDGVNYAGLGFVNSMAPGGSSSTELNYSFTDNNPAGDRQFYRLRQVDFDGRSKLSNIVLIKGEKPTIFTINGMFPNPATTTLNLMIGAPNKDKLTIVVSDMNGRIVIIRPLSVETGSNTLPVDVTALAGGTYMLKLISSNGEVSTAKFVKQ